VCRGKAEALQPVSTQHVSECVPWRENGVTIWAKKQPQQPKSFTEPVGPNAATHMSCMRERPFPSFTAPVRISMAPFGNRKSVLLAFVTVAVCTWLFVTLVRPAASRRGARGRNASTLSETDFSVTQSLDAVASFEREAPAAAAAKCVRLWRANLAKARLLKQRMLKVASDPVLFRQSFPRPLEIFDPYEPQWTCPYEERVGKDFGDGGKFVCGTPAYFRRDTQRRCLVYSIGSSGDFSFETDVLRRYGCEIHTFDPTGPSAEWAAAAKSLGVEFHPWGLNRVEAVNRNNALLAANPSYPLAEIMQRLGHTGRKIDILKIDCEGCEFDAFTPVWHDLKAKRYEVGQVQIEVHMNEHEKQVGPFFASAADAGFDLFHKERNHWGCLGWTCLEFSFIHAAAARDIFAFEVCPLGSEHLLLSA
jgi:hypothetical protein